MKTDFELLKDELRVLNPGVTDEDLNNMTDALVKFFAIGAKAIYEDKKQENTSEIGK